MSDPAPQPNGSQTWRPRLPTRLVLVTALVAVVALSGLIYLLYTRTRGPAEVLRDFAQAVDAGDCEAAFELVDERSRQGLGEDGFCADVLPGLDATLHADFTLIRSVYHRQTQTADVTIEGSEEPWRLKRHGNTWRVVLPGEELLGEPGA